MWLRLEVEMEVTSEFLADILETALEYGIDYWCTLRKYNNSPPSALIVDDDDGEKYYLGNEEVALGVLRVLSPEFEVRKDIRHTLLKGVVDNDAGNIDAEIADVVIQAAVFGEIVYG